MKMTRCQARVKRALRFESGTCSESDPGLTALQMPQGENKPVTECHALCRIHDHLSLHSPCMYSPLCDYGFTGKALYTGHC